MTVLGPISPAQLGYTLPHDHLLCDVTRPFCWTPAGRQKLGSDFYFEEEQVVLQDEAVAVEELLYFKRAGGSTIVDVTPVCVGRDPAGLRRIAQATGVHIVMGCGFYFELHHHPRIQSTSTKALAAEMERELTVGVDDTGIRAGIIGEIATNRDYISPAEERVFRAAARAQARTGAAITTHAVHGRIGLAHLDLLEEAGADLRRVVIGHCDLHCQVAYHEAIARRGAFVEFDMCNSLNTRTHAARVSLILELAQRGYLKHLLISQDICHRPHLHAYGGGGYDYLLVHLVPMLRGAGLSQEQVEILIRDNPRRMLAF